MSRSRFHSRTRCSCTSLGLAIAVAIAGALAGCGDGETCGPGGASKTGLTATGDNVALTWGTLTSGLNNDCPDSAAPAGVVSVTIFGFQSGGAGSITLCVSRPDLLADGSQTLGHDAASAQVRIVDLNGDADVCTYSIDRSQPVTGTATASGLCDNANDPAGFAITLDATLTFERTCDATTDTVQVMLRGTNAVATQVPF
jgi:hypothetical protein